MMGRIVLSCFPQIGTRSGCVCKLIGEAEVYGDWDAAAYLRRVVELIHPNRQINIPNLEAMIRAAAKDGVDICTYCPDYNCRGCIVNEWKEDPDDE